MGRVIRITADATFSVSAIRHLLTYLPAANQAVRVLSAGWDAPTSEDAQQLETMLALYTGTPTGATTGLDVVKGDAGDAAHGGTIHRDTPDADLTIVADTLMHSASGPINGGYLYRPTPEELHTFAGAGSPANRISMRTTEAPTAAVSVRPWMILELIGA